MKEVISTSAAPLPIGSYSQAIRVGNLVHISGQIGLDPVTGLLDDNITQQVAQIFTNLREIAVAAGGSLNHLVALTVYLIDLSAIEVVNRAIAELIELPWPARAAIQVTKLPRDAAVEISGVLALFPE